MASFYDNLNATGFAIRRKDGCLSSVGEVSCGLTIGDFYTCCPSGGHCPLRNGRGHYNSFCCNQPESGINCTADILETGPYCANATWQLYINNGFFCCDPSELGFRAGTANGCAQPTYTLQAGQVWATAVAAMAKPPAQPSTADSSSLSAAIETPLIGGIVGGIIAFILSIIVAMILLRRHRQNAAIKAKGQKWELADMSTERVEMAGDVETSELEAKITSSNSRKRSYCAELEGSRLSALLQQQAALASASARNYA